MATPEKSNETVVNPGFTGMHITEIEALLTGPGDEEEIVNEQDQNEVVNEEDVKTTDANE